MVHALKCSSGSCSSSSSSICSSNGGMSCVCVCVRMREKVGVKVVRALKRNNDGVSHAAIDMLCALMQVSYGHQKTNKKSINFYALQHVVLRVY